MYEIINYEYNHYLTDGMVEEVVDYAETEEEAKEKVDHLEERFSEDIWGGFYYRKI